MKPGLYLFSYPTQFPDYISEHDGKTYTRLFVCGPVTVYDHASDPDDPDYIVKYICVPSIGIMFTLFTKDYGTLFVGSSIPQPTPVESNS